jgi:hypothetical protein
MRTALRAVLLLLPLSLAGAAPAAAQDFIRYLLPVSTDNVPGALGSSWISQFTIHNPRDQALTIVGDVCDPPIILQPACNNMQTIPPSTSRPVSVHRGSLGDGAFLYVPKNPNYGPTPMTLRVRDLSKNASNFGTEVPIARDEDFVQVLIITDVPTDPKFRATLRVYNYSEAPRDLRMRVYTLDGQTPIEERTVSLLGIVTLIFNPTPLHPAYAELDPLTPAVRAAGTRVRIEVEDPTRVIVSPPPPPIWGLVSITNNETQQVTTITPHP